MRRRIPVALLGAVALVGDMFSAYEFASLTGHRAETHLPVAWISIVFTLSMALTVLLAVQGAAVVGGAAFATVGLGFLSAGITYGNTSNLVVGLALSAVGVSATFLLLRVSAFVGVWGAQARLWGDQLTGLWTDQVAEGTPRERRTRLCGLTELDGPLLGLLEVTVHRYSLGDLRTAVRLCCETRYSGGETFRRSPLVGAPPLLEACILTEKIVVILVVHTDGYGAAFVERLQQTMLSEPYGQEVLGPHISVNSAWLGSAEASSVSFPLDNSTVSREFVEEFRAMLTAARHT
ncbi:hypothetical protein GCM10010381_62280 [Streptomyces xantholiticus]|nr:hypothetical protein GCM10010381_62280 [Streptomyces xantholiticus]